MTPIQYSKKGIVLPPNELTSILEFSSIEHEYVSIYIEYVSGSGLTDFNVQGSLSKDPWFTFISANEFDIETPNGFIKYYNEVPLSIDETTNKFFLGYNCPYFNNFRVYLRSLGESSVNIDVYCK